MSNNEKAKKEFILTRVFDAPVERVWKAWTDPDEIKRWWGPKDFTAPHIDIDFREGGKYLYAMNGMAGPGVPARDYWSTGTIKKIIPNEKIVVEDSFSDEKGNIVPASYYGMPGEFPMKTVVETMFEKQDGKTKFTLRYPDYGISDPKVQSDMKQGWNQSLDKLEASLKS